VCSMIQRLALLSLLSVAVFSADFTTYIGDSHAYQAAAIATDSAGNTYITGGRIILSIGADVFVTKLDPSGAEVFTTTFGGKSQDQANAIALDSAGNIWVGGSTFSNNFPLHDAIQTDFGGNSAGFLVKLAPDGTVIYSSYFGGSLGPSSVNGVATDQGGNVYLTGTTISPDFPITPGMPAGKVVLPAAGGGTSGAFITKLSPDGLHVLYSGLIVGNSPVCDGGSRCVFSTLFTSGGGITVDSAGNAYIVGNTDTSDLPTTPGAFQLSGYGAFAAKVKATGNGLAYLTYLGPFAGIVSLGPSEFISATAIAIDPSGNSYLTGYTNDPDFPATSGALQTTLAGSDATGLYPNDAFVAKLNPDGTALVWGTYLGGTQADQGNSLAVDSSGNVWLAGSTSGGFPSASPGVTIGPGDFLAELKPDGSALSYAESFATGSMGQAIILDGSGLLHVAGLNGLVSTITPLQPFTPRILGIANAAAGPFSGRVSPGEIISIYGSGIGASTAISATPDSNGLFPKSLGGVQVSIDGVAAPLLYASSGQINAQVPFVLPHPDAATIRITNGSSPIPSFRVSVDPAIPGIFTNARSAAAINEDGTVNSFANPAKAGSIVSIWVTGIGVDLGAEDGQVSPAASNYCADCEISVNGVTAANGLTLAVYAGAAPGLIDGVAQINFTVPSLSGLYMNQATLTLTIGDAVSPVTILYVK
jgi:uncharacterized protein (TIGR03437 family)